MPASALPTLKGDLYRNAHQSSVDAILGAGLRRVHSQGAAFYNRDFWPLRIFVVKFCALVSQVRRKPTKDEIRQLVKESNATKVYDPHIVIANTPSILPFVLSLALTGGAYHEAFHTLYSRRTPLKFREVWDIIDSVWDKIDDPLAWARSAKAINDWANIVEDIRIERVGSKDFPGVRPKLADLQNFILDQEDSGRNEASHRGIPESALNNPYSVICAVFRDVGLGYNTERQRRALAAYRDRHSDAVDFVLDGPLSDVLRETIALRKSHDTACLRIAMEVLAAIYTSSQNRPDEDDGEGEGEGQAGAPHACTNCGAPKHKLKVQPKSDGQGGTIKGKGVLVCTACGYEEDIDFSEDGEGKAGSEDGEGSPDSSDDMIEYDPTPHGEEGEDSEDTPDGSEDGSEGDADDSEGEDTQGGSEASDGDSDGDSGEGSSSDSDDGDEDGDGADGTGSDSDDGDEDDDGADASGSDSDDGDDDGADTSGSDSGEGDSKGAGDTDEGDSDEDADGGDARGAGGHGFDEGPPKAWTLAQEILDEIEDGADTGLTDNNSALTDAMGKEEDKAEAKCEYGETPYRPYSTTNDSVSFVEPTYKGKEEDYSRASRLLDSVKTECSYLRARLRNIVRALEQTTVIHGVRRGRGLSERMLVDSKVALMGGRVPNRAYYDEDTQVDTSLAAVVVMDESSSMSGGLLQSATKAFLAITEPLDALGCPTMAIGFRNGNGGYDGSTYADGRFYHRKGAVHIDVFKTFTERFQAVKWRFANTRAIGSTPMADGVQFALEALSDRPEGHRVVFVCTDGQPDPGHAEVIRHQIRVAQESGILVIGVGIGRGAQYVTSTFPHHVYAPNVSELPKMLVAELNKMMDPRAARRGRKLRATG